MTVHNFRPATPARPSSNNPFDVAKQTLIKKIGALTVPHPLTSFPDREDFEAVGKHIHEAAGLFDAWLAAIGHQVKHAASCAVDMKQFEGAFTGAVEGNATFECETAALNAEGDTQGREASWPQERV